MYLHTVVSRSLHTLVENMDIMAVWSLQWSLELFNFPWWMILSQKNNHEGTNAFWFLHGPGLMEMWQNLPQQKYAYSKWSDEFWWKRKKKRKLCYCLGCSWVFQQDNHFKHIFEVVKKWLNQARIKVFDWPSKNPDLNPIEKVWTMLLRVVCQKAKTFK